MPSGKIGQVNIQMALDAFFFRNKSLSPQSQDWYRKRLTQFADWCKAHDYEQLEHISAKSIAQYLGELATRNNLKKTEEHLSSYTIHGHARILRCWFNWLESNEEFQRYVQPQTGQRVSMPRIQKRIMNIFSTSEIKRLFAACEDSVSLPEIAARNKAILAVLLDTGIRAGELCGLTLEHCFLEDEQPYIRVLGKGSKEREVGVGKIALAHLQRYLQQYRLAPDASTERASRRKRRPYLPKGKNRVFLGLYGESLTPSALGRLLRRLGKRAGVEDVHPHGFRHTFACLYLLQESGDLHSLSRLMGHSTVAITSSVYLTAVQAMQARKLSQSVLDHLS